MFVAIVATSAPVAGGDHGPRNVPVEAGCTVVPDPPAACTALDETRTAGLWLVRAVADLTAVPCAVFAV